MDEGPSTMQCVARRSANSKSLRTSGLYDIVNPGLHGAKTFQIKIGTTNQNNLQMYARVKTFK
jgi:hypothetical protein